MIPPIISLLIWDASVITTLENPLLIIIGLAVAGALGAAVTYLITDAQLTHTTCRSPPTGGKRSRNPLLPRFTTELYGPASA